MSKRNKTIARATETTLPAALIIAQQRQVLHTAPQGEIQKITDFSKMRSLFRRRTPMHSLASLSLQVEVRVPRIGPERLGTLWDVPGHRTMSLGHPQTDCMHLYAVYAAPQVLYALRDICHRSGKYRDLNRSRGPAKTLRSHHAILKP